MLASLQRLETMVGQEEAYRLVFDEEMPKYEKRVAAPDFASLQRMATSRLSNFFFSLLEISLELIPARVDIPFISRALDVRCGSGAWVRECARKYPDKYFVGLDKNMYLINYAIEVAQRERIGNASFITADMFDELPFHPSSFDLIRLCFLTPYLPMEKALSFLTNLYTYLFWTGKVVWIEPTIPNSNSKAFFSYLQLAQQVYANQDVHVFRSKDMEALVRHASFMHLQTFETEIDLSAGTPTHSLLVEQLPFLLALNQQFIRDEGVASSSDLQAMTEEISRDFIAPDFSGSCTFITVIAEKAMPEK
jgi:ubiquinone/menaquinone biosynthesis C-methylase UbiE